jgi:hypothetical protein
MLLHTRSGLARPLHITRAMNTWWTDLDDAVLECLETGPTSPAELAGRLGMSEASATSLLCLLAQEGRVRIALVESASGAVTGAHCAV